MKLIDEQRYFVKIRTGKTQALATTTYYRDGLTFQLFIKYRWFFKYRAALYQVQNPRHFVELCQGNYKYIPTEEERCKSLKDKIAGKRRTITQYQTKLRMAEQNWNDLFPIRENNHYQKAVAKIERLQKELHELLESLQQIS